MLRSFKRELLDALSLSLFKHGVPLRQLFVNFVHARRPSSKLFSSQRVGLLTQAGMILLVIDFLAFMMRHSNHLHYHYANKIVKVSSLRPPFIDEAPLFAVDWMKVFIETAKEPRRYEATNHV